MENRKMMGNTHVVHEGLQNSSDIRKKLLDVAKSIIDIANDQERHLTDVAMSVWANRDSLKEIGDEVFARHQQEKESGVMAV